MKGVSLFSDIFMLFVLMATMILISGLLWSVMVAYTLGFDSERNVAIGYFEAPLRNDGTLLAFLETTVDGIPLKTLVAQAAVEGSPIINHNGVDYDLEEISRETLNKIYKSKFYKDKKYLLKITNPEIVLAKSNKLPTTEQKTSVKLLTPVDTTGLEFYVQ